MRAFVVVLVLLSAGSAVAEDSVSPSFFGETDAKGSVCSMVCSMTAFAMAMNRNTQKSLKTLDVGGAIRDTSTCVSSCSVESFEQGCQTVLQHEDACVETAKKIEQPSVEMVCNMAAMSVVMDCCGRKKLKTGMCQSGTVAGYIGMSAQKRRKLMKATFGK